MKPNADGFDTTWFGPTAPKGKESNWIQTIPGKDYFLSSAYRPLQPWFDNTRKPDDLELVK